MPSRSSCRAATRRIARAWREAIPHGRSLPPGKFTVRHARLRRLLWLHVAALPVYSLVADCYGPAHAVAHALPLAVCAWFGGRLPDTRQQAAAVSLGLLTASATLVHVAHGATEAHFHFFVIMSALALYEDWLPYGIGVGYVFLHHAVLGALVPEDAFGHGGDPTELAAVHAGFLTAQSVANIALWRSNERARAGMACALRRAELQYEVTGVLARAVTLEDAVPELLRRIGERMRWSVGTFWRPEIADGTLRPVTMWTAHARLAPSAREFQAQAAFRPGDGVAGRAWSDGAPVWSEALHDDTASTHRGLVRSARQRSGFAIPILSGRRTLGVLSFAGEGVRAYEAETVELLESLSRQLALFMDRLSRGEEAAALRDAAMTDALTGLPNRRAWDAELPEQLAWAARREQPLCLALIDLDRFKAYNDSRGHPAGDALLGAAARSWTGAVRAQDLLARYGGEEFALAMPGCGLEDAAAIVERVRGCVPDGQTCSIGLTRWEPDEPLCDLLERADGALYAAKAGGRDRVAVAVPSPA